MNRLNFNGYGNFVVDQSESKRRNFVDGRANVGKPLTDLGPPLKRSSVCEWICANWIREFKRTHRHPECDFRRISRSARDEGRSSSQHAIRELCNAVPGVIEHLRGH